MKAKATKKVCSKPHDVWFTGMSRSEEEIVHTSRKCEKEIGKNAKPKIQNTHRSGIKVNVRK